MSLWGRFTEWAQRNVTAAQDAVLVVVKTTRYLRLGMIALVLGLGVSVLYEHAKTRPAGGGHCWQESISAYYYTPVQSFLVAALVAVGICLVALKGSTEFEDVALNFAGVFAPIVAFVPTPNVASAVRSSPTEPTAGSTLATTSPRCSSWPVRR